MWRWVCVLPFAAVCAGQPVAVSDVTKQYCAGCHNEKVKSGGVALDAGQVASRPADWEKAVRKLRARHMPPVGLPRPDERTYNAVIAFVENTLDRLKPDPGRTDTFRRLNRTEYRNAIRDLLALDVDVASLLPPDESSYGFDNVTVGDLPPALLERYVAAAGKISRLAVGSPIPKPGGDTVILPPDLTQEQHFEELPIGTRGGTSVRYTFPLDAEYDITVRLARDRNEHVEGLADTHEIEFLLDGERIGLFTVRPVRGSTDHSQVDKDLTVRLAVKAGPC
jgi:hypothetical protein